MGVKRKREILGNETYGATIMLIRVGYDMAFHFPEPTAIVLMLSLHPLACLDAQTTTVITSGQRQLLLKEDAICRHGLRCI